MSSCRKFFGVIIMKSLLVVVAVASGLVLAFPAHKGNEAFAAKAANEVALTSKQQETIKAAIDEIKAAAESGDEALVTKLLSSAIKNNPDIASKIVESFVASQAAAGKTTNKINVSAVVNNIVASLQNQPGSEALVAAVLSAYTPAAGGDNSNNNQQQNTNNENKNLPPELPGTNQVGNGNKDQSGPPKKSESQSSPHN